MKNTVYLILSLVLSFHFIHLRAKHNNMDKALCISLQQRVPSEHSEGSFVLKQEIQCWDPAKTAIIICDMWDAHWCQGATERVREMAPLMDEVISNARARGVLIVHAPSDCMHAYRDHPARKLGQKYESKKARSIISNAVLDLEETAKWPIDQEDGGCACAPHCKHGSPWKRQIETLEVAEGDAISDSGSEIAGLFWKKGVNNVILMGVHTNMCVIGRSFGLRNMVRLGFNVALMRDLTDTMYNPESWPHVNHFTGTSLVVEHIEKYVCPSFVSSDFTGSKQFRFKTDNRPLVAFIAAEGEYRSDQTLPVFAHELMLKEGINCEFAMGKGSNEGPDRHNIENLQILEDADLAVISVRRRALTADRMAMIRDYVDSGKPVLGIRTSSHAFNAKGPVPFSESGLPPSMDTGEKELAQWVDFDKEVIGGNYQNHYRSIQEGTTVTIVPGMEGHLLLAGVPPGGFESPSWMYLNRPLTSKNTSVLLVGTIPGKAPEPVMWINNTGANRVVYTSLGHWGDWDIEAFQHIVVNSIKYLLEIEASNQ